MGDALTLAMREALVSALDPVAFADAVGVRPDPWQATVLRSGAPRLLLNCSRQAGKSTVASVLALHRAMFHPESLVLLVSPSQRQSGELFRKVTDLVERMEHKPALTEENKLSLRLANGSRVVSLPGAEATVRGFSGASLIIEDEASRVDDELYRAVRPMLAVSGGRLVLMSTPFGRRGHFFEEWTGAGAWERTQIRADQVPRISPAFLEDERRALGEWWFSQEYMCEFADTVDALFSYEQVRGAFDETVRPLFDTAPTAAPVPGIDPAVRTLGGMMHG